MTVERIKRGSPSLREVTFYQDGTPTNDAPVTVGVTRADGTVVIAAGTATANPGTGRYTYTLPAQASVDRLTETWTGANSVHTVTVEIVGGFYVTEAQIRAMANTATFSDAQIIAARTWFEDTFEDYTGVAWVPRYGQATIDGSGSSSLILPHMLTRTVRSVTTYTAPTTSTAYTVDELAGVAYEGSGVLRRWSGYFTKGYRYVVAYEHGADSPPSDVVEAAKVAILDHLLVHLEGGRANRVFGVQTQDGIVRTSQPGDGRPFGIPEVDAVANRRRITGGVGSVAIA